MTMNKLFSLQPLLLAALCAASALALPARAAESGPDVARLLVDADRYRMTDDNLVVETRVTTTSPDRTKNRSLESRPSAMSTCPADAENRRPLRAIHSMSSSSSCPRM